MKPLRIVMSVLAIIAFFAVAALAAIWFLDLGTPEVVVVDPSPDGRRIEQDGLLANYFAPTGEGAHPGILLLGGSEGGLGEGVSRVARELQAQGYAVLHISYFGAPGQSRRLERIPLETFDRGLEFLAAQPEVDPSRLAVIGGSKGAEAALIVAARHPELRAAIAAMPSNVVWQGIDWNILKMILTPPDGSWSLDGATVPFLPYGRPENPGGAIAEIYRAGLAKIGDHPQAVIPVENARAAILLICGEADTLWPSCDMADAVKARSSTEGGPAVDVLAYADAGHAVFGIAIEDEDPRFERLASLGGSAAGNNAARKDAWPRMLRFMAEAFEEGATGD